MTEQTITNALLIALIAMGLFPEATRTARRRITGAIAALGGWIKKQVGRKRK